MALVLVSSCSKPEAENKITITIPEESNIKTYVVEDETSGVLGSREKRNMLNTRYYYQELEDKEKQRIIDEKTRNWRRVIDDEPIVSYDEEEDELFYKFITIEELRDC